MEYNLITHHEMILILRRAVTFGEDKGLESMEAEREVEPEAFICEYANLTNKLRI